MGTRHLKVALPAPVSRHLISAATADAKEAERAAFVLTMLLDIAPNTSTEWDKIAAHADAVDWVARKLIMATLDAAERIDKTERMLFGDIDDTNSAA